MSSILRSKIAGYAAAALGIAAVTSVCALIRTHINDLTVSLAMLLVVLFIATAWERGPAILASLLGMLCLNYFFLPPLYTFTIEDAKNWVALGAFFITALTAGRLSSWAKQQAAEAEASRSQARLASAYNRSLLEASLDPLLTIGPDGKMNDVNAAAEAVTGYSRAELIGTEFSGHFRDPEKARAAYQQVFRDGGVRGYALELRHRSGHSTSVLLDGSLYRDADGNVIGVVATARPIRTYVGKPGEAMPDPRVLRHLKFFVSFATCLSVAVGLLSIVGLAFQIAVLKSVIPGQPVIKVNTAVCLVLAGLCLWIAREADRRSQVTRVCGQTMAALVALVGFAGVTEHLFRWNLGIDQLLFLEPSADAFFSARPGLIAPITAADLLFLGLAFLLLDRPVTWRARRYWPAQHLASLTVILSIVALLDFVFGSHASYTHIALQTAITLLVVSLSLLCIRPDRGLGALLSSSTAGGVLTRRLLPAAVVIPIVIGALSWRALASGRHFVWSEVSLMTIAMITLLAGFAIWNGYIVNRGDVDRRRVEAALHRNELELREAQRLAQLGNWWWDPTGDAVTWSAGLSHLALRNPMLPPPTYKEHLAVFTPESAARLDTAIQRAIESGASFELDLEMVRTDAAVRSVTAHGEVERDAGGQARLVRGTVEDVTERKQAAETLQKSAEEIRDLYNHAPCGYHSLDPRGVFVRINDTELEWLQYTREEVIGKQRFTDLLTPEGLKVFEASFPRLKQTGAIQDAEFDLVRKDGTKFPVLLSASAVTDADGNYLMSRSTVYDITARKQAEDEIRLLALRQEVVAELGEQALRNEPLGTVLNDAVGRVARTLGVEYCKVLELRPDGKALLLRAGVGWKEGLVGQAIVGTGMDSQAGFTLLSKDPVVVDDLRAEQRFSGPPLLSEHQVVSGMSVIIPTSEGPYGVLGAHTRTRRKFTEDEANFLQSVANVLGSMVERRRAEEALLRSNRAHRALSSCNEALIRITDEATLLQEICRLIVQEAGYRFCWVGYAEQDESKTVRPLALAGFEDGYLKTANVTWADTERGRGPTGACIRTGQIQLVKNFATDPRLGPWRAEALKRGYASSLAVPLVVDSKTFGALTIYAEEPGAFEAEEVDLLAELAADLGFGITGLHTRAERERAEQEIRTLNTELEQRVVRRTAQLQAANKELEQAREREVEVGFRIQQTLLLDQPPRDVPGLHVAALTIPSQRIDGDFYIFIRHSQECLDVIIGDVMGKGIPAALLGAATKSHFLRALGDLMALSKDGTLPAPKDIVMLAHAELARHLIELDSFVTLCYARLDMDQYRVTLVDCGHTGVIHRHGASGVCESLHGDNLPLGVREGELYDETSVRFEPGDLLFFYSDGITEARNPAGELFGIGRLEEYVQLNGELDSGALVEGIRKAVATFSGGARLTDDLTSVAVRVEERLLPVAHGEVDILSDLKQLRGVREFVRRFCNKLPGMPLDEGSEDALELAVNEATSNIMKHAYHGRRDQWIHLDAEAFPTHLSVRLHHLGDPFDPSKVPPPPMDGSRESGFGAYIITKSVDEVRYYRDDHGRNCVALMKFRTPAPVNSSAPGAASEPVLKGKF